MLMQLNKDYWYYCLYQHGHQSDNQLAAYNNPNWSYCTHPYTNRVVKPPVELLDYRWKYRPQDFRHLYGFIETTLHLTPENVKKMQSEIFTKIQKDYDVDYNDNNFNVVFDSSDNDSPDSPKSST
jgi:hypothetical protein